MSRKEVSPPKDMLSVPIASNSKGNPKPSGHSSVLIPECPSNAADEKSLGSGNLARS
ncbi:hypothetical protein FGSG_13046 [Fusarium graminearum PH-1]|uniref:hypothetical protein n=1 Tax=Gibberella zeae (strain ATCC MYA-4620 / CBS 123657 / FGSC 9075 / NRRL 31084 / PH-1) TaxID=229533 RepID=UPI00021F1AA9|nr:hypothetical protein FGSG_13046 [Fusarium graminearum PH-1]ESU13221.1 hypothetical protein FGSG_13046 [Fusarium graminearum PH-1]|eukprot:XP_011326728.1 hypothetical protein FGSG_13046 [Fusarium graminearum PH-1]